jgi:hypothetical protein
MGIQDTLSLAAEALRKENIKFALIGGFALAAHGVVRATQDIDLLVEGSKKERAKQSLLSAGFNLAFENDEVMHFSGIGQIDTLLANRSATLDMLNRAKPINDFPVPVVSAEDIIGLKIQAYKNDPKREFQDKADIQSLLGSVQNLDFNLIKKYADLFDEWDFISELRKRI